MDKREDCQESYGRFFNDQSENEACHKCAEIVIYAIKVGLPIEVFLRDGLTVLPFHRDGENLCVGGVQNTVAMVA